MYWALISLSAWKLKFWILFSIIGLINDNSNRGNDRVENFANLLNNQKFIQKKEKKIMKNKSNSKETKENNKY